MSNININKVEVKNLNKKLVEIRRDFHMYPELSYEENRTSKKIKYYLDSWGILIPQLSK